MGASGSVYTIMTVYALSHPSKAPNTILLIL